MAFDTLAPTYDRDFTESPVARALRARVHQRLTQHFHAGVHILELGCGTGEDALVLANRGVRVTATDASEQMLAVARAKAANQPLVQFEQVDLRYLPDEPHDYDGVFANFGVLNCLDEWHPLAAWLAERLKPGGVAAFGVMSPLCLWEMVWHGLHSDFRTATRRLRRSTSFQPDPGSEAVAIRYPSVRRLSRDFAPHFRRTHVEPLGLVLPPSDVYGVIEKRPKLLKTLIGLEDRFTSLSLLAPFADHYWIEFERVRS